MSDARFSSEELATIARFVRTFCVLYGGDDFNINGDVRGIPPIDPELDALVNRLLTNDELFERFCLLLAHGINDVLGANSDMAVGECNDLIYTRLGVTKPSRLMVIYPHPGFTHATINVEQARERWQSKRVFRLDATGITILLRLDINALTRPMAVR